MIQKIFTFDLRCFVHTIKSSQEFVNEFKLHLNRWLWLRLWLKQQHWRIEVSCIKSLSHCQRH